MQQNKKQQTPPEGYIARAWLNGRWQYAYTPAEVRVLQKIIERRKLAEKGKASTKTKANKSTASASSGKAFVDSIINKDLK